MSSPVLPDDIEITVFDSLEDAKSSWLFLEDNGDCYAFQSFAWLSAWYDAIGKQSDISICVVLVCRADGQPLLLLPLGVEKRKIAKCLIWLGGALSDYQAPILSSDYSRSDVSGQFGALWTAIRGQLPDHDFVSFEKLPETINAQANPFVALRCHPPPSGAHFVRLDGDYDSFLKSKRSKKTLSTEKRKQRNLMKFGEISFFITENSADIKHVVDTMLRQKSENYREMGVPDLFANERYRDFVTALSTRHIPDGFVHMSALMMDDEVLAAHWGLVYKRRLYYLLPSYERGPLTRYSPGNMLLWNLFDWCFENDIEICDFTVGDEPYKLQWRDAELSLFDYTDSSTWIGHLAALSTSSRNKLKRRVKESPKLLNAAHGLRSVKAQLVRKLFGRNEKS